MDPLQFLVPLGWVDSIGEFLPIAILVVAIGNMLTRFLAHRVHRSQAEEGDDSAIEPYLPHVVSNFALVFLVFAFMLYRPVSGAIMTLPVVAAFIADLFEFESRKVEARNRMSIEWPKSSIVASLFVVLYAGYYGLQFLYSPYVDSIFA